MNPMAFASGIQLFILAILASVGATIVVQVYHDIQRDRLEHETFKQKLEDKKVRRLESNLNRLDDAIKRSNE